MKIMISEPELLNIITVDGEACIGGSQEWYEDSWHRKSGCGPVTASNIVWYIWRKQGLLPDYFKLIRMMYDYVTPTIRGVDSSSIFTEGLSRFASENGMLLALHVLDIPKKKRERPDVDTVKEFISAALKADSPVAFLNLSNGTVSDLENWHWVTVISCDPDSMMIEFCDNGKLICISISEWLETSMLGGALVYVVG